MMCFLSKKWRMYRPILYLIFAEFPFIVAVLTLTGIAAPNLYRTKLWQEGGDLGFNSKPITIVYSYANYRPVDTPLVWSQFTTNFNLIISVLSMFLLLTKMTMFILHTWYPILSAVVHAILVAVWAVAIRNQTAPDTIDPRHVNNGAPWYITKSCNLSSTPQMKGYCMQAKSTFAVSIIAIALYTAHIILAIHSCIPTATQIAARRTKIEEKKFFSPDSNTSAEEIWQRQWELGEIPPTPGTTGGIKSPFTPRTTAFNALGGGLNSDDTEPITPGKKQKKAKGGSLLKSVMTKQSTRVGHEDAYALQQEQFRQFEAMQKQEQEQAAAQMHWAQQAQMQQFQQAQVQQSPQHWQQPWQQQQTFAQQQQQPQVVESPRPGTAGSASRGLPLRERFGDYYS